MNLRMDETASVDPGHRNFITLWDGSVRTLSRNRYYQKSRAKKNTDAQERDNAAVQLETHRLSQYPIKVTSLENLDKHIAVQTETLQAGGAMGCDGLRLGAVSKLTMANGKI